MEPDNRKIATALLLTGMRYAELVRFHDNPGWLDGRFVFMPKGSMLKVEAKQKERAIQLSDMGVTLIPELFQHPETLPTLYAFDMYLNRLSRKVFEGQPVNNKKFRKTWESWLVYYYPDKDLHIALSQGHTTTTQYQHYLNVPFTGHDRKDMRKWVERWI